MTGSVGFLVVDARPRAKCSGVVSRSGSSREGVVAVPVHARPLWPETKEVVMKLAAAIAVLSVSLVGGASGQEARPDPPVLNELSREFPKDDQLEARVLTATIQPGTTSLWHTHPAPVVVYVIEGTITLEFDGREPVSKRAGEALLEPINVKVRAANKGQTPTRVVIFQISPPNVPFLTPTK